MFHSDEPVDIAPEMRNLRARLEQDQKILETSRQSGLNTLIYYFERFLDHHKQYEKTQKDLLVLDSKIQKLSEGDYDESY